MGAPDTYLTSLRRGRRNEENECLKLVLPVNLTEFLKTAEHRSMNGSETPLARIQTHKYIFLKDIGISDTKSITSNLKNSILSTKGKTIHIYF